MLVSLKHVTPIQLLVEAIRVCYDSQGKSDSAYLDTSMSFTEGTALELVLGQKDKALIQRIIKDGHTSTTEHINLTFKIKGLPRFILQELARHRIASLSVKSSRYTLSELKDELPFVTKVYDEDEPIDYFEYDFSRASKYVYLSDKERLNRKTVDDLEFLRQEIVEKKCSGYTNDDIKQVMPEAYLCDIVMTINIRSLRNLLTLRTSSRAHKIFQELARGMFEVVPEQYKFLLEDCVNG